LAKGEQAIWQHRSWERRQRDKIDLDRHEASIRYNQIGYSPARSPAARSLSSLIRHAKARVDALDRARFDVF